MCTRKNFGMKLASAMIAAGLAGGTASAAIGVVVNVTLTDVVSAGNTAPGSGQYTITEYP